MNWSDTVRLHVIKTSYSWRGLVNKGSGILSTRLELGNTLVRGLSPPLANSWCQMCILAGNLESVVQQHAANNSLPAASMNMAMLA